MTDLQKAVIAIIEYDYDTAFKILSSMAKMEMLALSSILAICVLMALVLFQTKKKLQNFVQWIFPTDEQSSIARDVPIVDDEVIALFQKSKEAQTNLKNAKDWYLGFLFRNSHWKKKNDHNHLRITRVIKCLRLLLGDEEADDFKQKVYGMVASRIMFIDEVAKRYWAKA